MKLIKTYTIYFLFSVGSAVLVFNLLGRTSLANIASVIALLVGLGIADMIVSKSK